MTPDEAWWHHWNEVHWLNDIGVKETYLPQDSEAESILDAVYSYPDVDEGCFYPCKQSDIDTVCGVPAPQPPFRKVSQRRALQELVAFNDTAPRRGRCMQRSIRHLDKYLFNRSWLRPGEIPDLVFKAFRDLDKVLFDGYLFDRVHLAWSGARQIRNIAPVQGPGLMGLSMCRQDQNGGFIFFCMDNLLLGMGSCPFEEVLDNVLNTLIHEMLHNYLYIRCYRGDISDGHPACWWEALEAIGCYVSDMFDFDAIEYDANNGYANESD